MILDLIPEAVYTVLKVMVHKAKLEAIRRFVRESKLLFKVGGYAESRGSAADDTGRVQLNDTAPGDCHPSSAPTADCSSTLNHCFSSTQ